MKSRLSLPAALLLAGAATALGGGLTHGVLREMGMHRVRQTRTRMGTLVTLTVVLSTVLHGLTAYPLARRYAALLAATRDRSEEEHRPVSELPVRIRHA